MAAPGGGEPSAPPSHGIAFHKLLTAHGKKSSPSAPPSFVKRLETIPEIDLPPDQPMRVAVSLAERGLVGQFMGLWPSTKTTDNWIQRNWRPLIQNNVTCYAVGRGYYIFRIHLRSRSGPDLQKRALFHGSPRSLLEPMAPEL
jgi:hypothetical protein